MTDDVFTPTPAAAWVDPNPAREVTLPSGNCAVVKKPNLYILGRTGQVPANVKQAGDRIKKSRAAKLEATPQQALDALEDFEVYVDWIVARSFVHPAVSLTEDDPAKGVIGIASVSSDDKRFVVQELGIEV